MRHISHMNFSKWMSFAMVLSLATASAQDHQPDPRHILEGARMSATLTKLDDGLKGQLRKGRSKTPVTLFLKGENIQFQYSENKQPWRIFHMRMEEERFILLEIVNGKTRLFAGDKLVQPIAGTDLTYEDLAMRFFFWPDPKFIKTEEVGGQECFRIRIEKPEGVHGRYETVEVWVHVKFGAFMQVRGYDAKGGLLKEFQVEDVMQVEKDTWTLRKMQVSTHDPKNDRRLSITDLTFDRPNKVKPRGMR